MNKKAKELVDNLDVILMNTTFEEADIDRSDVGTFYLSKKGLKKVLESLELADLALIDRRNYNAFNKHEIPRGAELAMIIPLAGALEEVSNENLD